MGGICGNYNGDPNDEYQTSGGKDLSKMFWKGTRDFKIGQSWQAVDLSGQGGT